MKARIESLSSLRRLAGLPPACDLTRRQWRVLETALSNAESRLLDRLDRSARVHLPRAWDLRAARQLNAALGEIELDTARAFAFFDRYMDILTQRHAPELGPHLAGCDVIAWDALHRDHPALRLVEPPIVLCDRGFGAAVERQSVLHPDGSRNPMPVITIPYTRIQDGNLASLGHEAGHEALSRLGLVSAIPQALRSALARAGAPEEVRDLFVRGSGELGSDFYAFCACGVAQPATIREILALPPAQALHVSLTDPHPPPFLRALIAFSWTGQTWGAGAGPWLRWEREWRSLYPLDGAAPGTREVLHSAERYVPLVARVFLNATFRVLNGKPIRSLFDLDRLAPARLEPVVSAVASGKLSLGGLPPCAHLAVFCLLRERGALREGALAALMSQWLTKLGERRHAS